MVHVWIDDVSWPVAEPEASKEDLWRAVNAFLAPQGRVPHTVTVDGEPLELEAFLHVTGGQEIRIISRPVRELVCESLDQVERYLRALDKGARDIADLLEQEKASEALPLLSQFSEGTEWMLRVLGHCQALLALRDDEIGDGGLEALRGRLATALQGIASSLEEGKYFELAYRMREELAPTLGHLKAYVDHLKALAENVQ